MKHDSVYLAHVRDAIDRILDYTAVGRVSSSTIRRPRMRSFAISKFWAKPPRTCQPSCGKCTRPFLGAASRVCETS